MVSEPDTVTERRPASLRVRLGLLSVLTLVVSLGGVGLALDAAHRSSAESSLQQQMETWMYLVLAAITVDDAGRLAVDGDLGDPLLAQPGSGIYAHVHGRTDHWSSPSALGVEVPELAGLEPGATRFETPHGADLYYTYQYGVAFEHDNNPVLPFTISVLADRAGVNDRVGAFRAGLWRSLGAAALLLILAQFLFFTLALRPFRQVAGDVAQIERGETDALSGPYPRELEPLTRNLDRLLASEKASQAHYRNALDSLAHSLKTPLAVLRAGLRGDRVEDPEAMTQALADMQRLITTRLERAGARTRRTLGHAVDVAPVAERLAATLRRVHSQDLRNLDCIIEPGTVFHGEARDLMELLGNLLDNACKYGQGSVRLEAGPLPGGPARPGCWMAIHNDGTPPDLARFEALSKRGARGDERVEGHGLGLAIVAELVNAYGGKMQWMDSDLGGACVRLEFPPA